MMKVGEVLEVAIWLTGTESEEKHAWFKREALDALGRAEAEHGVKVGPVAWTEKRPEEDRVPPVPDYVQGPDVRLLVGEAEIVGEYANTNGVPLSMDLEEEHLVRLRGIVRRKHAAAYPYRRALTDAECDEVIDEHGPDAAAAVVSGAVH